MAANGIPTAADLEAHLGEPGGNHRPALTAILEGILDMISGRAREVWIGPAKGITVILSGGEGREPRRVDSPPNLAAGKRAIYLPSSPAPVDGVGDAVTAVAVRDVPGGDWRTLDASEWLQEGRHVRRTGGIEWPGFSASVRVTYRAGYDEDSPMPARVRLGALDGAAAEWKQRTRAQPGIEGIPELGSTPRMPKTFWMAVDAVMPPPGGF